jgi:hypothetical protein
LAVARALQQGKQPDGTRANSRTVHARSLARLENAGLQDDAVIGFNYYFLRS